MTGAPVAQAIRAIAAANGLTAAMVVAGGAIGGNAQYVLWAAAVLIQWVPSRLRGGSRLRIAPAHFVERHGLVVIVAIGESVVAVGIGAAGLPVDGELVLVAVLGLRLSAGLWWAYFGADEESGRARAGRRPAARAPDDGARRVRPRAPAHPAGDRARRGRSEEGDRPRLPRADRRRGRRAGRRSRGLPARRRLVSLRPAARTLALAAVAALGALATIPLGSAVAAVVQFAALVALLAAALAAELRAPIRAAP